MPCNNADDDRALTRHNLKRLDRMTSREGETESSTFTPAQSCECSDLCSELPREEQIRILQKHVFSCT